MNITIDSGNTFTKIGFFMKGELIKISQVDTVAQVIELLRENELSNILISSVNQMFVDIKEGLAPAKKVMVLDHQTKVPLTNLYETPKSLGMDRLAAAVGANVFFKEVPCLVIDAGSCITYDLVDARQNYRGGGISPGINIRFKSLQAFTSKLPLIDFNPYREMPEIDLIGKSTTASILSGVLNGVVAEVNGMVEQYAKRYPDMKILICGGDANYFESRIKQPIFAIPELVHWGLNRIIEYNESEF